MQALWEGIIGQKRVTERLAHAIEQGRVGQAYLFLGPEGIGKQAVALAFAAALQTAPEDWASLDLHNGFHKAKKLFHPDIHLFFPMPKEVNDADLAARIDLLRADVYQPVDAIRLPEVGGGAKKGGKQAFYSVDRMNEEIKPKLRFKPSEGRYQVLILLDVETMRTEAANAFLKVLEEPNAQTVFILTTSRPERLLPTIISRCQQIRFDLLSPEELTEALMQKAQLSPEEARLFARMGDGSFSKAKALASNRALFGQRTLIVDFFRAVFVRNVPQMADLVDNMGKLGRDGLKGLLRLMLLWIRDLMLYQVQGETALLVNLDFKETIARFCKGVPDAQLEAMMVLVEEAHALVERNVNETLILLNLAEGLHRAMRRNAPKALYQPLSEPALVQSF